MSFQAKAFLLLAVFLFGIGVGWRVENWHLSAEKIAQLEANQKAFAAAFADRDAIAAKLSAADDKHSDELRKAQNETNRLRDHLANTSGGLRINALCPPASPITPATGGARVDIGTGAELAATARQAYFALRDGIDRASAQLAACQDELRIRIPAIPAEASNTQERRLPNPPD